MYVGRGAMLGRTTVSTSVLRPISHNLTRCIDGWLYSDDSWQVSEHDLDWIVFHEWMLPLTASAEPSCNVHDGS